MLRDLNSAAPTDNGAFDVCVIGAGPAGISMALELARKNKRVALCEAGGFEPSEESQSCYQGAVVGDPYFALDATRLRYFGGSTGHWSGWCYTLDDIDFARKDRISQLAHWPITRADLAPYLSRACAFVEIKQPRGPRLLSPTKGLQEIYISFSPPTRFGEKYRKSIVDSKNITLFLNANLTDLRVRSGRVTEAVFTSYTGQKTTVRADNYVFAMGGIENSRQLLWHNQRNNGGLYERGIPVGKYWMEHPHFTIGAALVDFGLPDKRKFFGLTPGKQMELGVLNAALRLEPLGRNATRRLVKDLMCAAPSVGEWAAGLAGENLVCGVKLRAAWEQAPRAENGFTLDPKNVDRFGIPAPVLHWRKSDLDHRTITKTALQFNDWLMGRKLGRLKLDSWVMGRGDYPTNDELGGHHHMGGTRMADSPVRGVVDRNCQVFGSKNLYVAGSSVFPSGGHTNPTLSIIQLSLRLADHLTAV
ncbi:MAG: FAD-dependent oxidoreductase [Pseudomonadota bacterium]